MMKLWHKVTLGLILGIIFGIYFPQHVSKVQPIGIIFLRLIKMIISPLIFFTLVSGLTSMKDKSALGRVGMKSVFAYLGTTFCAVVFGLGIGLIIKPGKGVVIDFGTTNNNLQSSYSTNQTYDNFSWVDFIINIVPSNIVESFGTSNVLQIVFFSVFFSIIINNVGSVADPIKDMVNALSKIVLNMIAKIVEFSPYGAFALTAWVIGTQGLGILLSLSKLVLAVVIAMICQYFIFGLIIFIFARVSPIPFYKKSLLYQLIALSTGSSKASLATTMQVCQNKLGISKSSTSFVLPLGASINMDGFAINLGLTTVFFAQMMEINLSMSDYLVIMLTSTLGSIGGAGIPSASLIMLPMVLGSVNIPIEGVAVIAGIDRVLDLLRTAINITGDATITLVIDASEGSFNKKEYYSNTN